MKNGKIVIQAIPANLRAVKSTAVRLDPEAYNLLVDFANKSGLPISKVATEIILQAAEHVVIE